MTHFSSNTAIDIPSGGKLSQVESPSSYDSQHSSTPVHLLDDDSLLIILSFCRLVILDESVVSDYDADYQVLDKGGWNHERWWYRLIQVCRRWRYLVLQSAFHLQVSLVCARGTPVADMLAHFPPLPLIIDHIDDKYHVLSPEDEEGIIFALQHRDRVRRIRIRKSVSILQGLIIALDGEFPVLEYLSIDDRRFIRPLVKIIVGSAATARQQVTPVSHWNDCTLYANLVSLIVSLNLATILNRIAPLVLHSLLRI